MATNISFISGSPLIGCPMIYGVTPNAHQQQYTFHRVTLEVYARLIVPGGGTSDASDAKFTFSQAYDSNMASGGAVLFDISSALRAVADRYNYAATPPAQYPYVKFRLRASDDWMIDGQLYEGQDVVIYPGSSATNHFYSYAFIGAFSDAERLAAASETSAVLGELSGKPLNQPEVVHQGVPFVYPLTFNRALLSDHMSTDATPVFVSEAPANGPASAVVTPATLGAQTIGTHAVYVVPKPANSVALRFINSKGVMESVHLNCVAGRQVSITTEKFAVARAETFKQFSRLATRKQNNYETWTLNSGALTEQWAEWMVHQLLMASNCWLEHGGQWYACHLLPAQTTTLRQADKAGMLQVELQVQIDLNGAL